MNNRTDDEYCLWQVYIANALFMGYLVVYSQEILYNARFGDIDVVNCTLTVFFHLPAIVVHAARLYLAKKLSNTDRISADTLGVIE